MASEKKAQFWENIFQLDFWIVLLSNLAEMKALLFQVHIAVQMSLSYKEKETLG